MACLGGPGSDLVGARPPRTMALRGRRISEQRARTEIARAFPELPVRDIPFLGAGMDSDAYLVDDEWVFRFPKREAAARALGQEVAVRPKLAGRLPMATPRFAYVGQRAAVRRPSATPISTCCTSGRTTARASFAASSAITPTRRSPASSRSSGSSTPATT